MKPTISDLVKKVMALSSEFDVNYYTANAGVSFVNLVPANAKRVYLLFYNNVIGANMYVVPIGSTDLVGFPFPAGTNLSYWEVEIDKSLILCQLGWQGRYSVAGPNALRAIDVVARG